MIKAHNNKKVSKTIIPGDEHPISGSVCVCLPARQYRNRWFLQRKTRVFVGKSTAVWATGRQSPWQWSGPHHSYVSCTTTTVR